MKYPHIVKSSSDFLKYCHINIKKKLLVQLPVVEGIGISLVNYLYLPCTTTHFPKLMSLIYSTFLSLFSRITGPFCHIYTLHMYIQVSCTLFAKPSTLLKIISNKISDIKTFQWGNSTTKKYSIKVDYLDSKEENSHS